jgi:hypothetical protein
MDDTTRASTSSADPGASEQAREKAAELAGQAQEKAQQAAEQAKGQVRSQVDERSTQVGERVGQRAQDIRSVADELRKQGKDAPARMADQAADRAGRLGDYLRESDADRLLGDVEDLARRQPWTVVLGGLAAGFAASRFLKASSAGRYQQSRQRPGSDPGNGAAAAPASGHALAEDRSARAAAGPGIV